MADINNIDNASFFTCCTGKQLAAKVPPLKAIEPGDCVDRLPPHGSILAPWVCIRFKSGGRTITVGNNSMPEDKNTAVIKSFEYGHRDGFTMRVTIEDQKGGSLEAMADHLTKNWNETDKYVCFFQFGWIRAGCRVLFDPDKSPCFQGQVKSLDTSYSQGKFYLDMVCVDLIKIAQEGASEAHIGSDDQPVCLTDAIKQLLNLEEPPHIKRVSFVTMENGKTPVPCGFEKFEAPCDKFQGPKGKWHCLGEDKLDVIKRWVFDYRSENLKGWLVGWDEEDGSHLVFQEDIMSVCETKSEKWWQDHCLGRFTINAGRDSSVIEFNPKMNWLFDHMMSVQGVIGDQSVSPFESKGISGKNTKSPGRFQCPGLARAAQPGAGKVMSGATTENVQNKELSKGPEEGSKGKEVNMKADLRLAPTSIEGDLVIVGDPNLVDVADVLSKTVQLKMINPFFVTGLNPKYKWLAFPPENYVIRNSAWIVKGVTHRIELGKYTTTINLQLSVPGTEINAGEPFGGSTDGFQTS